MEGLYTNIPHDEGLQSLEDGLKKRINPEIPTDYLIKLMEIILSQYQYLINKNPFTEKKCEEKKCLLCLSQRNLNPKIPCNTNNVGYRLRGAFKIK